MTDHEWKKQTPTSEDRWRTEDITGNNDAQVDKAGKDDVQVDKAGKDDVQVTKLGKMTYK